MSNIAADITALRAILLKVYGVALEVDFVDPGDNGQWHRVISTGGDYFAAASRSRPFQEIAQVRAYLEGVHEGLRLAETKAPKPSTDFAGASWFVVLADGTWDSVHGARLFQVPNDIEPVSVRDVEGHSRQSIGVAEILVSHFGRRFH